MDLVIGVVQPERAQLRTSRIAPLPAPFSIQIKRRDLEDQFAVERKSVDDLANCCLASNRERFEHELHRLRGFGFRRLLIIGSREDIAASHYHSRIAPKAVLATLGAFEVRYLPIVFAATPEAGALLIEQWVWYYGREVVENANMLLRGCSDS
jgi:hypothetical protein